MSTIKVKGMSCRHCVMAVTKALKAIDGIEEVQVDLDKGEVAYSESKPVDREVIKGAIKKAGYEPES